MMKEGRADTDVTETEAAVSALQSYKLDQPLSTLFIRRYFLYKIFRIEVEAKDNGYESYFNRYASLCRLAAIRNRKIESISHWQMASIVEILHDRFLTKDSVVEQCWGIIRGTIAQDETEGSIFDVGVILTEVAAGLWLMLSVGKFPGNVSYDEPIPWEKVESQDALVSRQFPSKYHSDDSVKLPQTFTAAHLEQIAGIEVVWTSNLADHLLLKGDDTKLMLFHQVSVMELHQVSRSSTLPNALIDDTLIDETIRSISLLIPPILGGPNPWFQQQKRRYLVDASAGVCERLNSSERQIDKFLYWRDRLVLLKRTFDDAEPRNISQLWSDDRKKTQWFTFWVAVLVFIMTVFFGTVQSVAGIVQAWASVKSLKTQCAPNPSPS